MRRVGMLVLAILTVAAACTDSSDSATTTRPETAPETTTTEVANVNATKFEPGLAAELVALEEANDSTWTIENAVAAVELLRPILASGVDAFPPIDVSRLAWFLSKNRESLTAEQRSMISASPPSGISGALVSNRYAAQTPRDVWQDVVKNIDIEFERLTGDTLEGDIVVALSPMAMTGGLYRVVSVTGDDDYSSGFKWLFSTSDETAGIVDEEGDAAFEAFDELYREKSKDSSLVCAIIIGTRFQNSPSPVAAAGMMHEVTHCHQHAAHPAGPEAFFASPVQWMDEGYAAWAGEASLGGTTDSAGWWDEYHDGVGGGGGHRTPDSSYIGIAFFSYLHDNGVNGWDNFRKYFEEIRPTGGSGPAQFDAMFHTLSQTAQAAWAGTSLQRTDLGDLWTYTTGPGIGGSTRVRQPRQLDLPVGESIRFSLPGGEQGTYSFQPRLDGADAAVLRMELDAPGTVRWPWGQDEVGTSGISANWCLGPECVCEDGTVIGTPAPEFTESNQILAGFTGGGVLLISLKTPEEACEDPVETLGQCPSGEWVAGADETEALLLTLYQAFGVTSVDYKDGPITMSFFESGTYRFDYRDTTFTASVDGDDIKMVLTGGASGVWEATDTELTVSIDTFDIQALVTINGATGPTGRVPGGEGGGTATYVCAGDTLVIDPDFENPFWPYPRTWTQVAP